MRVGLPAALAAPALADRFRQRQGGVTLVPAPHRREGRPVRDADTSIEDLTKINDRVAKLGKMRKTIAARLSWPFQRSAASGASIASLANTIDAFVLNEILRNYVAPMIKNLGGSLERDRRFPEPILLTNPGLATWLMWRAPLYVRIHIRQGFPAPGGGQKR